MERRDCLWLGLIGGLASSGISLLALYWVLFRVAQGN